MNQTTINMKYDRGIFSLNTGFDLKDPMVRKIDREFIGINNVPLKLNIHRIISYRAINTPPKPLDITIPKSLNGQKRLIRIMYGCAGLTRANSLIWYPYYAKKLIFDDSFTETVKQYLKNNLSLDDNISKDDVYAVYVALLTNMWSFLARTNDPDKNGKLLNSIKKALLKDRLDKDAQCGREIVNSHCHHYSIATIHKYNGILYHEKLVSMLFEKVQEKLSSINIDTADWTKKNGGIPINIIEKIHFALLTECPNLIARRNPRVLDSSFKYLVWLKRGKGSMASLQKKEEEIWNAVKNEYNNVDIDDDCMKISDNRGSYHHTQSSYYSNSIAGSSGVSQISNSTRSTTDDDDDDSDDSSKRIHLICRRDSNRTRHSSQSTGNGKRKHVSPPHQGKGKGKHIKPQKHVSFQDQSDEEDD